MIKMEDLQKKDSLVKWIGDLEVNVTSDIYDGKILDTQIEIEGGTLCWVCGEQRQEFIEKMQALVNEYRI